MSTVLDIQLGRLDLLQTGSNRRHCLRVLPSSKEGKKQKLVLGADDGVLQAVSIKKGEPVTVFKNPPGKREVTALALGGPAGAKDRVYAAFGQTIQGVNKKKGAQFFLYSTVLNEDISSLYVEDLTIYTACEYSLNVFEANKSGDAVADVHFYQSPDKIHHLAMTKIGPGRPDPSVGYNSILACQDKHVRVIKDSDLLFEARVDGAAMEVQMYDGQLPPEKKNEDGTSIQRNFKVNSDYRQVIYGTDTGAVGQYFIDQEGMRPGFVLGGSANKDNLGVSVSRSGVTAITLCDVTLNGTDDIVVGRDDGAIEVYQYDTYNPDATPVFARELNESITTLEKGQVIANNSNDILVHTYAGKVLAFTHELKHSSIAHIAPRVSNIKETSSVSATTSLGLPGSIVNAQDGSSTNIRQDSKADLEKSIKEMKLELEKLSEKITKEKEKYSQKISTELIAVEQQFKLKTSFKLLPAEACYLMTLEIDIPLDCVTLQSNIPVMLLDAGSTGHAAAAVAAAIDKDAAAAAADSENKSSQRALLSRTERDEKNGNELLATYRIQEAVTTNRLEIKLRTVEGQHGALNVYVIPKIAPKSCQKAELRIKPLSLHEKVDKAFVEQEMKNRPMTTLTITGSFTMSDIHSWVIFCLPDVSAKLNTSSSSDSSSSSSRQQLYFRSTFLGTLLTCEYEKGRATFRSDSITAISILKEVITKEATSKKIAIAVDLDLKLESIPTFLRLLRPELDQHFTLARKHALIAPLREIATHELGVSATGGGAPGGMPTSGASGGILQNLDQLAVFLQPSYVDILRHADAIEAQYAAAPRHLDFLRGIVTDLFVDKHKLQGKSAQSRVPQLLDILENYEFDKLLQAFKD